jgi:predicted XRE-type DNA-binding protein
MQKFELILLDGLPPDRQMNFYKLSFDGKCLFDDFWAEIINGLDMLTHDELLKTKTYWTMKIQNDLFNAVEEYLKVNNLTRTQFAEQLGVSKGYVTQILNGEFDHRVSKLVEIILAIGKVPDLQLNPSNSESEGNENAEEQPAFQHTHEAA